MAEDCVRERHGQRGWRLTLALALFLAALIGALGLPTPALAADYVVTNINDSGPGSLRDAINFANITPGPNSIAISEQLSGTIVLTSGTIYITEALTITGSTDNTVAISGNNLDRVFTISIASNPPGPVEISNLTITGGNATVISGGVGGGILNNFGPLTLTNVTVTGNTAAMNGGGIYNSGNLTLSSSTISSNTAQTGGGIYNTIIPGNATSGSLTLTNATISANTASTPNSAALVGLGSGGGIANVGGTVSATGGTISGNTASYTGSSQFAGSGGGLFNIYLYTGTELGDLENGTQRIASVALNGTTVSDNSANGGLASYSGNGGGIASSGLIFGPPGTFNSDNPVPTTATLTLTDVTLSGNDAWVAADANYGGSGGAIANVNGTVMVTGTSSFSANTATGTSSDDDDTSGNGGAIASLRTNSGLSAATVTAIGATFQNNTATALGGAIANGDAQLTVTGGSFAMNAATGDGGAIANIDDAQATVTGATIDQGNSARFGGGIYNSGGLTVQGSTIAGNTAAGGGGLYNDGTDTLLLINSTVATNSANDGGGLYNALNADATLVTAFLRDI